ncbi:MAG TPA: sigma-70 family RNA polymerase sigma factor [Gaiellales bacterium]|jgi:RNA polymerase sigma-70 factor (ECF subfamily)
MHIGVAATRTTRREELEPLLEEHRRELTGYCYRMLGSAFEAEDAVQETMVRAWRSLDRFEGRASLRSWLYRIATNVCLDMIGQRDRRAMPMDMGPAVGPEVDHLRPLHESAFVEPVPDARVVTSSDDPAEQAAQRETLRLAFVAALQHLPPRQRAVLILREVLHWQASEAAELLDTTVQSVNSSLQRARATIASKQPTEADVFEADNEKQHELLERYLAAFEGYDMEKLKALLAEDAVQSMPPYDMWLRGRDDVLTWWFGPGIECKGSRLVPTVANGLPAFGQYRPSGPNGEHEPWALQVLEIQDGAIVGFTAYLDTARMFPLFGLPMSPPAA